MAIVLMNNELEFEGKYNIITDPCKHRITVIIINVCLFAEFKPKNISVIDLWFYHSVIMVDLFISGTKLPIVVITSFTPLISY